MDINQPRVENVANKIKHNFEEAAEKNEQQLVKLLNSTLGEQRKVMLDWGCDATCVKACTANFNVYVIDYNYCTTCECPSHIKIT
tara:strand:+ start:502 stop:756 length:255 start_codon:yes stop_codon:yes gene_type:complete